ncbi:hypothetical protein B9Z55_020846 [Caenorhabditis nigoni]|nr:hypothetical protein B9Z55_020846 [Caenorhabditis nigoni]
MLKDVISIVPNLMEQFLVVNGSVPDFIQNTTFHTKCCKFENPNVLENINDEYLYLTGTHYQSWKYFPDRRDEFLGYLKPLRKRLYTLPQSNNFTYVKCVHIRRGDFPAFKIPVADRIFILNALKFIESKEKVSRQMTATVFFGDDFEFMHGLRADVPYSFVSQNEPVDDIFYAKNNCDLVLITAPRSTFGWWLGYFSKGNKTYHMDILYTDDYGIRTGHTTPSDYFLPHWTPLKYAGVDNFTVVESIKSDFY